MTKRADAGPEPDAARLEERERRLARLQEALIAGERSGDGGPLDVAGTKRRARAEALGRRRLDRN